MGNIQTCIDDLLLRTIHMQRFILIEVIAASEW